MMAAGRAAEMGAEVLVLEKMEKPGKKILVSGKTRCNLTNERDLEDFLLAFGPNGRFLYGAFSRFFRDDLLDFMRRYGVETKLERGGRIFPVSDRAADVVKALNAYLDEHKVRLETGVKVTGLIHTENGVQAVTTEQGTLEAGAVVLAAGGSTWPATGSTGDGVRIAAALGHNIIKLRPALIPLVVHETDLAKSMQGISLKNVRLTSYRCTVDEIDAPQAWKKIIDTRMGEMMITHFGLGGPLTLQMSLDIVDALESGPVSAAVDLKPALEMDQLQLRLQRDFDAWGKRAFRNILKELLPQKMIGPFEKLSGIPGDKPGNQINAAEKDKLASLVKSLRFGIKSPLPMAAGMVTAGGIDLREIDPRTMASKKIRGLYCCGEVLDLDADTGGYNLQAAFSTGRAAGESAAAFVKSL